MAELVVGEVEGQLAVEELSKALILLSVQEVLKSLIHNRMSQFLLFEATLTSLNNAYPLILTVACCSLNLSAISTLWIE